MKTKKISLQTNYNGKLACDRFIHVDVAPSRAITETELRETVFEIHTADESHPPVFAQVDDMCRITLQELLNTNTVFTWCSHAMDTREFGRWILAINDRITPATQLAVWFYLKVNQA